MPFLLLLLVPFLFERPCRGLLCCQVRDPASSWPYSFLLLGSVCIASAMSDRPTYKVALGSCFSPPNHSSTTAIPVLQSFHCILAHLAMHMSVTIEGHSSKRSHGQQTSFDGLRALESNWHTLSPTVAANSVSLILHDSGVSHAQIELYNIASTDRTTLQYGRVLTWFVSHPSIYMQRYGAELGSIIKVQRLYLD
ncbi:hypothetical protein BC628DRAFT_520292 [Trametes gibbosa]|nr:hypothetical protein BC628DRAFT_520292 [Trametes gibbosa]